MEDVSRYVAYAVEVLLLARYVLIYAVRILDAFDLSDGTPDWPFVGRLATFVEGLDDLIDALPTPAPSCKEAPREAR